MNPNSLHIGYEQSRRCNSYDSFLSTAVMYRSKKPHEKHLYLKMPQYCTIARIHPK